MNNRRKSLAINELMLKKIKLLFTDFISFLNSIKLIPLYKVTIVFRKKIFKNSTLEFCLIVTLIWIHSKLAFIEGRCFAKTLSYVTQHFSVVFL